MWLLNIYPLVGGVMLVTLGLYTNLIGTLILLIGFFIHKTKAKGKEVSLQG